MWWIIGFFVIVYFIGCFRQGMAQAESWNTPRDVKKIREAQEKKDLETLRLEKEILELRKELNEKK